MKTRADCLPCILHQALQVARTTSDDEWSQRKVINEVLRHLPEEDWSQSPAEILAGALRVTRNSLRNNDPFEGPREQVQATFAKLAAEFAETTLASADDPFVAALTAAAAANVVDEMVFERFSKQQDPKGIFHEAYAAGLALGKPDKLLKALDTATTVLYLLDNAGEVSFDKLLIDQLKAMGKQVLVYVRGQGLLHDATRVEAIDAGLPVRLPAAEADPAPAPQPPAEAAADPSANNTNEATEEDAPKRPPQALIDGKAGQLGVPTVARSTNLGVALDAAQVVIAKGSANYETFKAETHDLFFLLRVKCPVVAHSLGTTVGSLVLHHEAASAPLNPEAAPEPAEGQ